MPRIKIEFNDEVQEKLFRLGKESPASLDRVLASVSMATKTYIIASEKMSFISSKNTLAKATKYNKSGKLRYKLAVSPRYQVLEKGAYIKAKNAKALRFYTRSGDLVFAKSVRIPKRPFFKQGLRSAISENAINRAAEGSIELEFKRLGLK